MKKILTLAAIAMAIGVSSQAQTIKLMKDGKVIASYPAEMVDAVVFSPESQATTDVLAGVYETTLNVSLLEMPAMGIVTTTTAAITVTAASDGRINISFPACTYVMNGAPMTLPAVDVTDIDVTLTDGVYSFSTSYSGVEESTSKAYSGTVEGSISAAGVLNITNKMKYGSMPFTLNMQYTNTAAE